ncbi:MAG: DNA protecting protein DprA [Gammaproteobacteria bacterium RIFCSPHIGHO2_12_FULL_43_28]|nr:MAG: DNA protecting protein DprA [Gammaproteobacteria bacterium RIFCSPHIGHO2_12_FULL_43_28]
MNQIQLAYWLALNEAHVPPQKWLMWLDYFGGIHALFHAMADHRQAAGMKEEERKRLLHVDKRLIEKSLTWADQTDCHLIAYTAEDYPQQLKETAAPPALLYVRGAKKVLSMLQLAIVGSRRATTPGLKNAESFACALAEAGIAVTSGLALGVDGAAHRGALRAKGVTIGVAGTGLAHIYPAAHRSLFADIVDQGGAIITEFPLSTPPHPRNFPRRNRIIAGLSHGVLVVEAALKSGSLVTARHAVEAGRDVFAIPGSIHQPLAKGCHYLIQQGAKLVESAQDILDEMAFSPVNKISSRGETPPLSVDFPIEYKYILDIMHDALTPLDVIIVRSGLTASEVSSILLTLELHGLVQSIPGGYVRLAATK